MDAAARTHDRSPVAAALLSFLLPGLGQAWAGQAVRAVAIAAPAVFVAGVPLGAYLGGGITGMASLLLSPGLVLAILVLNGAFLGYHAWAIVDGYRVARRTRRAPLAGRGVLRKATVMGLLTVTVASHALVGWVGWNGYDLMTGVFGASNGRGPAWGDDATFPPSTPSPSPSRLDPSATPSGPTPTPFPTVAPPTPIPNVPYWSEDGRLVLVLLGGDAGPGRASIRTDSMLLLSVDLRTSRAVLSSFPRNLRNVPLPAPYADHVPGGTFPNLLNALWRWADEHPRAAPGNDETRGFRAISAAIGNLAGVEVDGLAYVDLNGFIRVIDALGGVDINVPYRVYDAEYPNENGIGDRVVNIGPGQRHLDGRTALAFARSRHQDSDYGRIERQQLLLLAIRRQANPCTLLPRLPELVAIAKDSMYTNIAIEDVPQLLAIAARVSPASVEQLAFTPGDGYPEFVTRKSFAKMRADFAAAMARAAVPLDPSTRPGLEPVDATVPPGTTPELRLPSC